MKFFQKKQPSNQQQKSLHSDKLTKTSSASSTQQYLDIESIHDDVVILKNGTMRAILMVSSTNFALKSEDEQNAIIYAFQNLLNSLDYPFQIIAQSRQINIKEYLVDMEKRGQEQKNELLKIQTIEYADYIKQLVNMANIMRKRFFVVVPFFLGEAKIEGSVFKRIKDLVQPAEAIQHQRSEFLKYKSLLDQRAEYVSAGLSAIGLKSVKLNTEELIELFYELYNPELAQEQPFKDEIVKNNII